MPTASIEIFVNFNVYEPFDTPENVVAEIPALGEKPLWSPRILAVRPIFIYMSIKKNGLDTCGLSHFRHNTSSTTTAERFGKLILIVENFGFPPRPCEAPVAIFHQNIEKVANAAGLFLPSGVMGRLKGRYSWRRGNNLDRERRRMGINPRFVYSSGACDV